MAQGMNWGSPECLHSDSLQEHSERGAQLTSSPNNQPFGRMSELGMVTSARLFLPVPMGHLCSRTTHYAGEDCLRTELPTETLPATTLLLTSRLQMSDVNHGLRVPPHFPAPSSLISFHRHESYTSRIPPCSCFLENPN